ncbi:MAG: hypothetical protein FWH20_09015 [Oscillospiraceae bacterium]|nr:hypothetical protein [Oscillospiraceae bacterium]
MAYETKSILASLANNIAKCQTVKEAYLVIVRTANVEGVNVPSYEEALEEIEESRK